MKQQKKTVRERQEELKSALMDFPDEWDMIQELAEASIPYMHFRQRPELRELAPGEERSRFEIEGYASAFTKWSKEYKPIKDRYNKALAQIEKYGEMKRQLAEVGKKK